MKVDYATALHEAGHAVIGQVLGMMPERVTAVPDEDSGGHTIIPDPYIIQGAWDERGRWLDLRAVIRARILSYMAGREAEEEILGGARDEVDEDDRYQIILMLEQLPDLSRREARMRRIARGLVRRHRSTIDLLATRLMEGTAVEGDELIAFVAAASSRRTAVG